MISSYDIVKRVLDIIISLAGLVILLPFLIIVSLAIFIEDFGPVIYWHKRVGKDRKLFTFYKFRSMVRNADEILFSDEKMYKKMRSGINKIVEDPRVTKVGKFIRKYSIDELPQLINVLKGDMSFVGPRAYRPDELANYEKTNPHMVPYLKKILTVKPGITGYWQVSGRSKIPFDKRVKMEAEYADKKSILFDLRIILKTPLAVLRAEGAY